MKITLNEVLTRTYTDNRGDRKVVYFTLTDDNGIEYKMLDDLPAEVDTQGYLDANIDKELLFVKQEEYKGLPVISATQDKTLSEAIGDWIADGCKIITGYVIDDEPVYNTIVKQVWRDRW